MRLTILVIPMSIAATLFCVSATQAAVSCPGNNFKFHFLYSPYVPGKEINYPDPDDILWFGIGDQHPDIKINNKDIPLTQSFYETRLPFGRHTFKSTGASVIGLFDANVSPEYEFTITECEMVNFYCDDQGGLLSVPVTECTMEKSIIAK